jgi:hypothetical protein
MSKMFRHSSEPRSAKSSHRDVTRRGDVNQRQLELPARGGRGGYRPGAGRPRGGRGGVPHRMRPALAQRFPVHVTLSARFGLPSLRLAESRGALTDAIATGRDRLPGGPRGLLPRGSHGSGLAQLRHPARQVTGLLRVGTLSGRSAVSQVGTLSKSQPSGPSTKDDWNDVPTTCARCG